MENRNKIMEEFAANLGLPVIQVDINKTPVASWESLKGPIFFDEMNYIPSDKLNELTKYLGNINPIHNDTFFNNKVEELLIKLKNI